MDMSLDPTPVAAAVASAHAPPLQPSALSHPSYSEMITAAISALGEQDGSSKKVITDYIETNFSNLPPNNSVLLAHHLKRLKDNGQIWMVKHSYKLSTSAPMSENGTASDPAVSPGPKRRPGRPPKTNSVQPAVPVFGEQSLLENNVVPGENQPQNEGIGQLGSVYVAVESVNEPGMSGIKRGRGRPPKQSVILNHGLDGQIGMGRGRGRPKKAAPTGEDGMRKLSRGRPRKLSNVEAGAAVGDVSVGHGGVGEAPGCALSVASEGISPMAGKRRGRPPKAGGEVKKPRVLSGKPLGRPKKNASEMASQPAPDNNPLLKAYLDLKGKLEYVQSTLKRTVSDLRSGLHSETAIIAVQELETLATMDVGVSNVQPRS